MVTTVVRPGRPRDPELDEAVLAAALELLTEVGFARMTMKDVAARAGVSRTSLYRRWPATAPLVVHAVRRRTEAQQSLSVDTGSVRGDLLAFIGLSVHASPADLRLGYALATEVFANPELADAYRHEVATVMLQPLEMILERGVERGELPKETDIEMLADLAPGLIMHRMLLGKPIDEAFVVRLLDQFFPNSPCT